MLAVYSINVIMLRKIIVCCILLSMLALSAGAQQMRLALLEYGGGGDWYANPTALKNLAQFCNQHLGTRFDMQEAKVQPSSAQIFNYPYVHATGHGRIFFTEQEAGNLRLYLESGGFLHLDDNYGLDEFVRPEMKKVFPELTFVELPFTHPIFHQKFTFSKGLPKIHEHDGKPPQAFGLIWKGRLVCLYTYGTDLGDGWEDPEVHQNPPDKRQQALQMGANIIQYVFNAYAK